jgi:hypothetical protein
MFRLRACAILRELKVPDEICLRYVMGAEESESGCWVSYVRLVEFHARWAHVSEHNIEPSRL